MQGDPQMVNDPYNAFCTDSQVHVKGADAGSLAGLTFAAKDIFDVAGHVCGCGNFGLCAAATLQAIGSIHNCPFLEYPIDPPAMTVETQQMILKDPILIDGEGYVQIPSKPGIGVEIDEEKIAEYL